MHQVRWQDALDIGIITFLVYRALQIVRGSRAMQMIIGLAVIHGRLRVFARSRAFHAQLDTRQLFSSSIILVIIVIFQSDIRRALTQVGTAPLFDARAIGTAPRRHCRRSCPSGNVARRKTCRRRWSFFNETSG